jgi:hypothetical protein
MAARAAGDCRNLLTHSCYQRMHDCGKETPSKSLAERHAALEKRYVRPRPSCVEHLACRGRNYRERNLLMFT